MDPRKLQAVKTASNIDPPMSNQLCCDGSSSVAENHHPRRLDDAVHNISAVAPRRPSLPFVYEIERIYSPYRDSRAHNENSDNGILTTPSPRSHSKPSSAAVASTTTPPSLPRILSQMDPITFPSPSQARKAIEYGRVLILPSRSSQIPCHGHTHSKTRREHLVLDGNESSPDSRSENSAKNDGIAEMISPSDDDSEESSKKESQSTFLEKTFLDSGIVARRDTKLLHGDRMALRCRVSISVHETEDETKYFIYPQSATKYVDPPDSYHTYVGVNPPLANVSDNEHAEADLHCNRNFIHVKDNRIVVYQNEEIAVVNKPEGMDTMCAKGRDDLQSLLPFVLRPPSSPRNDHGKNHRNRISDDDSDKANSNQRNNKRNDYYHPYYLPKPIHRLDKQTSGCILIAKTEKALVKFSDMFATRRIRKSYCAIVFGRAPEKSCRIDCDRENERCDKKCITNADETIMIDGKTYHTIDYPVQDKPAVTHWRTVVVTHSNRLDATVSLLHLIPKTGRNHQLRRHLAYCLGCPIVGDGRYGYFGAKRMDDCRGVDGDGGNVGNSNTDVDGDGDGDGVVVGEKRKSNNGSIGDMRKKAAKELGMFLCSNELGIPLDERSGVDGYAINNHDHDNHDQNRADDGRNQMNFRIDLPDKYYDLLGVSKEDVRGILF
ncbi:hypothetical protein ACHAXS_009525 [Conticribra weissflogii]